MNENGPLSDMLIEEQRVPYIIFQPDNPASVENLVSHITNLSKAIARVKEEVPDLLLMDEGTLKEKIHSKLTLVMNRLRLSFWQEYENAIQNNRQLRLSNIFGGICTDYHWSNRIITDNEKVAWILCPPANYTVQVKEALQAGMETIREIVSAKVIDDNGYLIPRAADVVLKTVAMLDMRVKGAIIQRIDQRSLNVNVDAGGKDVTNSNKPQSISEIDMLIEQTKQKLKQINAAPISPAHEYTLLPTELEHVHSTVEIELGSNNRKHTIIK